MKEQILDDQLEQVAGGTLPNLLEDGARYHIVWTGGEFNGTVNNSLSTGISIGFKDIEIISGDTPPNPIAIAAIRRRTEI